MGVNLMKYQIVCVGNIKEKFYTEALNEYTKRLSRFADIEVIELAEEKLKADRQSEIDQVIKKESDRIIQKLSGYVILCDIGGKMLDSVALSQKLEEIKQTSSTITFVIGGSFGVDNRVREKANYLLSFSKMTFPHQLMRVILAEQVYRAETIVRNVTYHK